MRLSPRWILAPAAVLMTAFHAYAGSLFYVAIPAKDSDQNSGLDARNAYTSLVKGGALRGGELGISGAKFSALALSGNTSAGNNVTFSAATGTLANAGGKTESIQVDGKLAEVFSTHTFNDGAESGSEQYIVLDPASLVAGKTYDLRVYICNASGQNRLVNLAFSGDDQPAVETDFFNEDDATTSPGGFADPNQAYYINYRFTWDGDTTPGVTITQRLGATPFCLYAVSNQEVPEGAASTPPPGAVAEAPQPAYSLRAAEGGPTRGAIQTDVGAVAPEAPREEIEADEDVGVTTEVFERSEALRQHGRWVEVEHYGRCWQPTKVSREWSPYTVGRWRYAADGGWTWDSDEDFGWATYHYGRWFRTVDSGWCWVPGRVWAPSWCSWRYGGGHVGWAPLPPEARYRPRVGVSVWADTAYDIGPGAYRFCNVRDLAAERVDRVILPPERNVTVITQTTNITNITSNRNVIYSGGPNFYSVNNTIIRGGGQALAPVRIERTAQAAPLTPEGRFSVLKGNVFAVAAPRMIPVPKAKLAPVAAKLPAAKIDKGWAQIADQKAVSVIKTKMTRETQGLNPQSAPAVLPPRLQARTAATAGAPAAAATGTPWAAAPQGKAAAAAVPKPGQRLRGGERAPGRPGQPAAPGAIPAPQGAPAGEASTPGAAPATPTATPSAPAPGQPLRPGQRNGAKGARPGAPLKPGQPAAPAPSGTPETAPAATPAQPGEAAPAQPATPPARPGKPGKKGGVTKPGQPISPAPGGGQSTAAADAAAPATQQSAPAPATPAPATPAPALEKPGKKNGRGQKPGQPVAPSAPVPPTPAEPSAPEAQTPPGAQPSATDVKPTGKPGKPGKKPGQPATPAAPEAAAGAAAAPTPAEPAAPNIPREAPKPGKRNGKAEQEPKPARTEPPVRDSVPEPIAPPISGSAPAEREPAAPSKANTRPGKKGQKGADAPVKPAPAVERPRADEAAPSAPAPEAPREVRPPAGRELPKAGKPGKSASEATRPERPAPAAAPEPAAQPERIAPPRSEPPAKRREQPTRAPEPAAEMRPQAPKAPVERRAPVPPQAAESRPASAAPPQPTKRPEAPVPNPGAAARHVPAGAPPAPGAPASSGHAEKPGKAGKATPAPGM